MEKQSPRGSAKVLLLILLACAIGFLFFRADSVREVFSSEDTSISKTLSHSLIHGAGEMNTPKTEPVETTTSSIADVCSECGQVHPGHVCPMYGGRALMTLDDLPPGNVRSSVEQLTVGAQQHALLQLSRMNFRSSDELSVRLDSGGTVYHVCLFTNAGASDIAHPMPTAESSIETSSITLASLPSDESIPITNSSFLMSSDPVAITNPPIFHSNPGSPNVLFLDFNGHEISNTFWNVHISGRPSVWYCTAFDLDGDNTTFSAVEQHYIRLMWERVSEDFAVYDVDVTTEQPAVWTPTTAHAMITPGKDANGASCPHDGWGGMAYYNYFGKPDFSYNASYCRSPVWISIQSGYSYEYTAQIISHELGHNLGLSHDGPGYYAGHSNGYISWGPIMGIAQGKNLSQWCKGEYYNADRTEDDLAIMASKLQYKPDDYSNTIEQSAEVLTSGGLFSVTGIVERTSDSDIFSFTCLGGTLVLTGSTYRCLEGPWGGNGDLVLQLYDSGGSLIVSNNPALETTASITQTVTGGTYYLKISPTGAGNPMNNPPSGYTSYGSIGPYTINGSVPLPDRDNDSIPDDWELLYFGGTTNADPNATASNGVNTVMQAYIAGISPLDSTAFFKINSFESPAVSSNGLVVSWNGTNGRVYSVNWTTNLLNSFQTLTNIIGPQSSWTNTTYSAEGEGFYRIKVQLQ